VPAVPPPLPPPPSPPAPPVKPQKSELVRLSKEVGQRARSLERSANNYWLAEFLRRNAGCKMQALVLGTDFRQRDVHKLLLVDLGAVVDCKSSTPLELGATVDVAPSKSGTFAL